MQWQNTKKKQNQKTNETKPTVFSKTWKREAVFKFCNRAKSGIQINE